MAAPYLQLRTYGPCAEAPEDRRFFCLPHFVLEGRMQMTFFTYGATAEEAQAKASDFWEAEIAKARSKAGKSGAEARGRPVKTLVTPDMLKKIDDFDPKG